MTGTINTMADPPLIKTGGCPWCGRGIQRRGTADEQCGWCPWPDPEAHAARMRRLLKRAKPRFRVRAVTVKF